MENDGILDSILGVTSYAAFGSSVENHELINALIGPDENGNGVRWGIGSTTNITFSFMRDNATQTLYYDNTEYGLGMDERILAPSSVSAWTPDQILSMTQALKSWEGYANVNFTYVVETESGVGDIRFGRSQDIASDVNASAAPVRTNDRARLGDILFNETRSTGQDPSREFETTIHEIAHSLLSFQNISSAQSTGLGEHQLEMGGIFDSVAWTTISLNESDNAVDNVTPMYLDLLALRAVYGAVTGGVKTGDDLYVANAASRQTIWDEGGNDTLVWEGNVGAFLNMTVRTDTELTSANRTTGWSGRNNGAFDESDWRVFLAPGTIIENVVGGGSDDIIIANDVSNSTLRGGAGVDRLVGNAFDQRFVFKVTDGQMRNEFVIGDGGYDVVELGRERNSSGFVPNVNFDFNGSTFVGIEEIEFLADLTSTSKITKFDAGQFGAGKISNTVLIDNDNVSQGTDTIEVSMRDETTFTMEGWTFTGWRTVNAIVVDGDNDAEIITGSSQADTLNGFGGNDILKGGAGADTLNGGNDNDTLNGGAGRDHYNGGNGTDTVSYALESVPVVVDMIAGRASVGGLIETFVNVENFVLGSGNDEAFGDANANAFYGGKGDDTLDGGAGHDTLYGGVGADDLVGGSGIDYARYNDADHGNITASLGNTALNTNVAVGDTYVGIEGLIMGTGNDRAYGDAGDNFLFGMQGNDMLWGGAGADRHVGGTGLDYARYDDAAYGDVIVSMTNTAANTNVAVGDTFIGIEGLIAGSGNDRLTGNAEDNFLIGARGNDMLSGGAGADVLNGGEGFDYARYDDANHGDLTVSLVNTFLNTRAAAGDSYIDIEGLVLGAGNDSGQGSGAADFIFGMSGNDVLSGQGGNDRLNGGAGNDRLVGGALNDRLTGGADADTFVFRVNYDADVIWDFAGLGVVGSEGDRIDLRGVFADFAAVDAAAKQVGSDVEITVNADDVLTLRNYLETDLMSGDFIL